MLPKKHYTLQIHIAGIFFVVVSALSFILIILSYHNSKALNEQLASERAVQNAEQIKASFQNLVSPVVTSLDTLAASSFGKTLYSANNKLWISTIDAIMTRNPDVLTVYLGYPDESSAFIRSTKPRFMKEQFSTPDNSHIMVDINMASGRQIRTYYDADLSHIDTAIDAIEYSPTSRPWYTAAPKDGNIHVTDPYFYQFIQRMGITLSRKLPSGDGVLAADITIASLENYLNALMDSPSTQLMLLDDKKRIFAHTGFLPSMSTGSSQQLYLDALAKSPLNTFFASPQWEENNQKVEHDGQTWVLNLVHITFGGERGLWLAKAIPETALIGSAIEARNNQIIISAFGLLIGTLMVLCASRKIATPLKQLGLATQNIRRLDFSSVDTPTSNIVEVRELSESVELMSETIGSFLDTLHRVSNSNNFDALMSDIVCHCHQTVGADTVHLWTKPAEQEDALALIAHHPANSQESEINMAKLLDDSPEIANALSGQAFFRFTPSETDIQRSHFPADIKHAWLLPLYNRDRENVGCVLLGFHDCPTKEQEDKIHFIQQFLGFASLIKENWDRVSAQKHLFKSFIEMIASAIDTKSPYTGGHCQRVPELTFMLAEEVDKDKERFPEFSLDEQSQEALYFASWLHDCGKVTTPEYVVDKATKLETIYNRIHEIRTRFEVLKRDAEITYWQKRFEGEDERIWRKWLGTTQQKLDEDFAFIAKCNVGGEFMDDSNLVRLDEISKRTWVRTIDDSLGLSWEETARRANRGDTVLPAVERVLDDKTDHQIPWLEQQKEAFHNWEFSLKIPELQHNRGELYNLSIQRGTLNDEERFIINDHIIQTIKMLRKLPYPNHLRNVPEIAGGHHEKLDGKGYPYGLDEASLSVDARIMAVADIFEALTASDRPYKKAKTLSEALKILAFMAKDKHIDPALFHVFIKQKVYQRYADTFLPPSQHDAVNEEALLAIATPPIPNKEETPV
ncbi:HD domain-containing protein [Enterovibrio sp. ZSDZ35]|uniref:HD domain-containing protein n=1 Tax=Enterovibrio qingdaonensis TaxID=2899818 RepID=A0ABT5QJY3_9GAMM|nr:HD domain-containing phosphohydrolase [Enterovibrio sp. ZSDZ35]MDD1781300.1 HD domain-containing protein [Enterovibrio sp. ZSDZ35]